MFLYKRPKSKWSTIFEKHNLWAYFITTTTDEDIFIDINASDGVQVTLALANQLSLLFAVQIPNANNVIVTAGISVEWRCGNAESHKVDNTEGMLEVVGAIAAINIPNLNIRILFKNNTFAVWSAEPVNK